MFNISDKVVLIDDKWNCPQFYRSHPILGRVYVIRDMKVALSFSTLRKELGFLLVGVINDISPDGTEWGFDSRRFRKLDEIKAENAAKNCDKIPT